MRKLSIITGLEELERFFKFIFGHHHHSSSSAMKYTGLWTSASICQADPLVGKEPHTIFIYLFVCDFMHIIKTCMALQQNLHNKIKKHSQSSCQSHKRLNILSAEAQG